MPGKSRKGFFDFSIKRENLYAFGFGGRSQFVQKEVASNHDLVILKIESIPAQTRSPVSEGLTISFAV